MKDFCVIDIETAGLSARPESFLLGCVYGSDGKEKKHFLTRESMIAYILKGRYKYVFAHNAEFDFTILFDNLILNLDRGALFVGSMFIRAKRDKIHFMNSLAILKSGVAALGKASGNYKLVLNDKFKTAKPGDRVNITKRDIKYCYRDCEIVYDYLKMIFGYTGKMKPTIASCAMEIFTSQFNQRKIFPNEYFEKFRESYYGGRVECFRFGKIKPCYKYDVNSLYPYVCTDMYFPDFNKIRKGRKFSLDYFKKFVLMNNEGCVKVTVEHKESFLGVLPVRKETEIIYPVGKWTAWYNFNELRKAYSTGLIKIKKVYEYYYAPPIFYKELSDYMKHFYDKKNNTKGAEKLLFKFILNALTGKFGQKQHGDIKYFENIKEANRYIQANRKYPIELHHFHGNREDLYVEVFRKQNDKKTFWKIPLISSYITSQARVYMLDFYLSNKDRLCYTDTDSLILTKPMKETNRIGSGLGYWKKEGDNDVEVIGNKHYYSKIGGKKIKMIKGVRKDHVFRNGYFHFKRMIRTKESIRRGGELKAGMFVGMKKGVSHVYTKRVVKRKNTLPVIMC